MAQIPTRVLIVDDEHDFVEMLSLILREGGISVTGVPGGNECLELLAVLAEDDVDVIILDVWMPGINGIETLKKIKKNHPLIEVIMLTGHGNAQDAIEAMQIGAFDFLLKPTDYDELVSKLEAAARRKREQVKRVEKARIENLVAEKHEKTNTSLPAVNVPENAKSDEKAPGAELVKTPARVLIVDDEKDFVEMLAARLENAGDDVSSAYSGKECLEILDRVEVDVVFLDLTMPGMDGIKTLRNIKERFPLVEVIVLTAHASVDTAVRAMRLGAYDYLLKPTELKDLKSKLNGARKRKDEQQVRMKKALNTPLKSYF
ncbi:MAG: response regulator [Pseudomonadota bacterium]